MQQCACWWPSTSDYRHLVPHLTWGQQCAATKQNVLLAVSCTWWCICTTIAIVWENTLSLCMQILTMEWTYFFKSNATSIRYCLVLHSLYILPKTFICHFRVPTWQYSCVLAPSTNKFPSELNWALPEKKRVKCWWNASSTPRQMTWFVLQQQDHLSSDVNQL